MLNVVSTANVKLEECNTNQQILSNNLSIVNRCVDFVKCVLYTSSDTVLFYTKEYVQIFILHITYSI